MRYRLLIIIIVQMGTLSSLVRTSSTKSQANLQDSEVIVSRISWYSHPLVSFASNLSCANGSITSGPFIGYMFRNTEV